MTREKSEMRAVMEPVMNGEVEADKQITKKCCQQTTYTGKVPTTTPLLTIQCNKKYQCQQF